MSRFWPILGLLVMPAQALAYNFLDINPKTGDPLKWDNTRPITYYLDPGGARSLTNDQVRTLIEEMMKLWETVPTAKVPHFEFGGYLPEDVTLANYEKYLRESPCYEADSSTCASEIPVVIVIDDPGPDERGFLGTVCGIGGQCSAIAGATAFEGSLADPGFITQGFVALGGMSSGEKTSSYAGRILHELGHLLGLAHSSINEEGYIKGIVGSERYMPTMFFTVYEGLNPDLSSQTRITLSPDDIAGISVLYPADTFSQETATIKGDILKSDNSSMIHVNVIARNIEDPLCEAFSFLSYRAIKFTGTGYAISGLPPGSYTIEVEEVANNLGFALSPGLLPDEDIYGDSEFWNEGDAAGDPSNLTSSVITLAPGETRENVDIILNRSEVTEDRIKYIPLDTFTPGPGTRCPEEPPVDYAAMIGIDEGGDTGGTTDTTDPTGSSAAGGCSLVL